MVDPVALPLRPEVEVPASHLFYDQDGEITEGMTRDVEVGIYWFLCSIILDVTAVSIEADVERILCFSHILLLASSVFDKECRRWKKGIVHAGSQLKKGIVQVVGSRKLPSNYQLVRKLLRTNIPHEK